MIGLRTTVFRSLAAALLVSMACAAQAKTQHSDLVAFQNPDGSPADFRFVDGFATLKRSDQGVLLTLETSESTEGDAYTIWFVVFNNPGACDGDCDGTDLGIAAVAGSVLNGGGGYGDADGNFSITSFLPVGFIHTNPLEPTHARQLFGPGLQDPKGAEIHIILKTHGPSLNTVEQISTVAGDCNTGVGAGCHDPAAAAFLP